VDLGPKGNPEHFLLLLVIIIIIHSLMMFAFFRLNFENEVIAVGSDDAKWEAERVGGGLEGDVVAPGSGFGHVAEVRVVVCELGGGIVLVVVARRFYEGGVSIRSGAHLPDNYRSHGSVVRLVAV
jgi:hypothetical protein|tara:strand:- start:4 stop:378 length:375 start_codon:yes stop_codon:yes gene_type:complete